MRAALAKSRPGDCIRIFVDRSGKIEHGWCVGAGVVFLPGKFGPSVDLYNRLLKGIGTDYLPADLKLENVEETPRLKRVLHELVPQLRSMGMRAFAIVIPEMQRRRNLQRWREMYWEDSIEYAGRLARRLNGTATLYSDAFRGKENQDEIRAFRKAFDRLGRPPYIEPYLYLCDSRGHLGIFLADVIAGSLRNFF